MTATETPVLLTLRQARAQRLLTVRALAAAAGCSTATVTMAEAGRRVPTFTTVRRLAKALRVRPDRVVEFRRAMGLAAGTGDPNETGER